MNRRQHLRRRLRRRLGRLAAVPAAVRRAEDEVTRNDHARAQKAERVEATRAALGRLERAVQQVAAQNTVVGLDSLPPAQRRRDEDVDPELDRGRPSWVEPIRALHRTHHDGIDRGEGYEHPIFAFNSKLEIRSFVTAHDVEVPRMWGDWDTPEEVPFEDFGDQFVVKRSHGFGASGVYPVSRDGDELVDAISKERLSRAEIVDRYRQKHREDSRYYVEEFLTNVAAEPGRQADDIKVYAFYGVVAHIEVWRDKWTRYDGGRHGRIRAFAPDGTPLGHTRPLVADDPGLPGPVDVEGVVEIASRLSAAIRRPFARFDIYETERGLVFGELAKNPSATPILDAPTDRRLGEVFEDASARLLRDLVGEGALGLVHGPTDAAAGPR